MHPDDLEEARRKLNESWVPFDERFGAPVRTLPASDPACNPPPDPAVKPRVIDVCNHDWKLAGRSSTRRPRKRCSKCRKSATISHSVADAMRRMRAAADSQ